MKTFKEFIVERELQETLRVINYKPGAKIPSTIRSGGPEHMNPLGTVNPSRLIKPKAYMPVFRNPQQKSGIVGK